VETRLPNQFSTTFLDLLILIANGSELGDAQRYVIEALESLTMIKRYRDQLLPYYERFVAYYKEGLFYNCNLIYIVKLFSKLTLFQDIDYEALGLDTILFDLFFTPIEDKKTAVNILMKTNPDFLTRFEGINTDGKVKEV
jgi:hypothetical protein